MFSVEAGTIGVEDLRIAMRQAAAGWPQVAFEIAARAMELGRQTAIGEIEAADVVFRGKLAHSIEAQVRNEGINADAVVIGTVLSTAGAEAGVMEWGRHPGEAPPPVKALLPWIAAKFGSLGRFTTKSGRAKKVSARAKDSVARQETSNSAARRVLQIAFALRASIGEKGFKGIHYFEKAGRAVQGSIDRFTDRALSNWRADSGL